MKRLDVGNISRMVPYDNFQFMLKKLEKKENFLLKEKRLISIVYDLTLYVLHTYFSIIVLLNRSIKELNLALFVS